MNFYVAPLEGITGYIFRNIFNECFGTGVNKYYTPFLALCSKKGVTDKEKNEISPENNKNYKLVPQVMTVCVEDFLKAKEKLRSLGYDEININFGCPARTVTSRGRGSGALRDLEKLDSFLDGIYKDGDENISIKTRIGVESPDEFGKIMEIYNKYPIKELTIHPRTMREVYKGIPHRDVFIEALNTAKMPVCYNGDINSVEDYIELCNLIKEHSTNNISGVMIGRGILKDPALIRKLAGGENTSFNAENIEKYEASNEEVRIMLCKLQNEYTNKFSGQMPVLYKLKEIWAYLGQGLYVEYRKLFKKIMKCKSLEEYENYMNEILSQ